MSKTGCAGALVVSCALLFLAGCAQQGLAEGVAVSAPAEAERQAPVQKQSGPAPEVEKPLSPQSVQAPAEDELIRFMLGSTTLRMTEKRKLLALAERLKQDRTQVVMLLGHANDNGSAAYNLAISDGRVAAVATFLRKQGVAIEQVRKEAVGSERNPSNCKSQVCRQRYRSVEIVDLPPR